MNKAGISVLDIDLEGGEKKSRKAVRSLPDVFGFSRTRTVCSRTLGTGITHPIRRLACVDAKRKAKTRTSRCIFVCMICG